MGDQRSGRLTRESLASAVAAGTIDTVLVAMTDVQGRLQGKRMDARFLLEESGEDRVEGCAYVLASDVDMRTLDGFALTSWDQGYGDVVLVPDWDSTRLVPWHVATAIVFCDVRSTAGADVTVSPRQVLQRQVARLAERGWTGLTGTELEFLVFMDRYEEAWSRGYRDLTPANQYNVDYSLLGTGRVEPFLGRVRRAMRGAGMVVESAKGECNFGQHEIAFRYADLVDKCDEHGLFKLGVKEIAAQEGLSATFMAKFNEREGNSCHIHLSLRDEAGRPVFAGDGPLGESPVFSAFLGGLIAHARELSLLLAPNVNSYKRFVAGSFAPTALAWGLDNRTCAFRVVGHGGSLRVECRIPGGDVNPYLAEAALVAAGLAGIDEGRSAPPPYEGNAYEADVARVPATLSEAIDLFEGSTLAREAFGEDVVAHYGRAGRVELETFQAAVTDWERLRGFERL